ncbi:MAG: MarR family transcriptional regulator [Alphaproteobacteria bacterium]|nr:MarR family transcriptional regulator [Alphaproteobacteria bacterium]
MSAEFYARLKRRGVPVRRWRLLGLLWDREAMTIGELARGILIEQSSTTRLVDRAAADGLVEKFTDARDRRRVRVRITPAGRDYIADLVADAAQTDRAIAAEVDASVDAGATERLKSELRALIARLES